MDGIEQALAGKLAALEDGETAGVERQIRFVLKPDGAQRRRFPFAPERDVLGGQILLQDGNHGRLVLVNSDGLG